jgi:hypothetical protein
VRCKYEQDVEANALICNAGLTSEAVLYVLWVQPLYANWGFVKPFDFFLWFSLAFVSLSMIQQLSSKLPFLRAPNPKSSWKFVTIGLGSH